MATDKKSTKRHRSPAYPSVSLRDAVEKAQKLYALEKLNEFDPEVALEHWGYESGSANGMRVVAALKQYGLLSEERGEGDRSLKLNDLALDILLPEEEGSNDHKKALREAALGPVLFQQIWDRHKEEGLPSDRNLERYLIKDKKFNPTAVRPVIRIFRDTLEYAGMTDADTMDGEGEPEGDSKPKGRSFADEQFAGIFGRKPVGEKTKSNQQQGEVEMRDLPVVLPSMNIAVVRVPAVMDQSDYDTLMSALKLWKPGIVKSSSKPPVDEVDDEDDVDSDLEDDEDEA